MRTRNFLSRPVGATAAFGAILLTALLAPFSSLVVQSYNMAQARRHLPAVASVLSAHPEFAGLRAFVGTAGMGCTVILGTVARPEDLAELRQLVAGTRPPRPVTYSVRVGPPAGSRAVRAVGGTGAKAGTGAA